MSNLYTELSEHTAKRTTELYSTSFSLGIKSLGKELQQPIYNIYGLVRLADEIVDTFHETNQRELLESLRSETFQAIKDNISINPIVNAFQQTVNEYSIGLPLIERFFDSMFMDLEDIDYTNELYKQYINGSAEVVGLMCLHVFTKGDTAKYKSVEQEAMALGSALQKVNFLRDLRTDYQELGRLYFPNVELNSLDDKSLKEVIDDIQNDFDQGLKGIKQLDKESRFAVYLVYTYYQELLNKIKRTPVNQLMNERIRVSDIKKYQLLITSWIKHRLNKY